MPIETTHLHFDPILERAMARSSGKVEFFGTDSTLALALFLSQSQSPLFLTEPHVICVSTQAVAEQLLAHFDFFHPAIDAIILPAFDVSPYSGLYPNPRTVGERLAWLHQATQAKPKQFFIASIESLLQNTIPARVLKKTSSVFRKGFEIPADLSAQLSSLGYQSVPLVEDLGTFAIRGGIFDLYSPAHRRPVRVELFGDTIESIRFFDPSTQRSEEEIEQFHVVAARECLFTDEIRQRAAVRLANQAKDRKVDNDELELLVRSLAQGQYFPGADFLLGDFYENPACPLDHFQVPPNLWFLNPIDIERTADLLKEERKKEFLAADKSVIRPEPYTVYSSYENLSEQPIHRSVYLSKIEFTDSPEESTAEQRTQLLSQEIKFQPTLNSAEPFAEILSKIRAWKKDGFKIIVATGTQAQGQRLRSLFEKIEIQSRLVDSADYSWNTWLNDTSSPIILIPRPTTESLRLTDEKIIFLRDEDFFGKKSRKRELKTKGTLNDRAGALAFSDLNVEDRVVHVLHGIGIYQGLKVMPIAGVEAEFIQLAYRDGDKLYLPIYRIGQIQKYSGPGSTALLDKLGGIQWQKTTSKVRSHLRELAHDLLELYAKRSQMHRPPFPHDDADFERFEAFFPYDETDDQLKAVSAISDDLTSTKPMDRLVCGDVGFGKTEVAMRAAFKAVQAQRQVAVLAPTTVLTFQHLETFKKRFKDWPISIKALNRFVSSQEIKATVAELKEGKVDIVIGTHRLLSKDIAFKNLGLLIIDEEQKFGVTHKERIRKIKTAVDTLALSATPIPRTLNMSLVGMRDLSIINTAPVDRLPTRTFVCKYDEDTIRKAILSEISRGGQVFYLHNRVQSIYGVADELRKIVPEARLKVGHGQMEEEELEKTMVAFFSHEIDILVCTTIIESGIDNPRANTMIIDNAHTFGLSQLYQLRGRVGRSKERAYCYLLIPAHKRLEKDAQERLKVIQENTALGSGIRIAHHDLELRGAGNILGEDQSGNIDAVGYEMYLELLDEALRSAKGETILPEVEPDINVRIPALIPDSYIPDLRIRLAYYKSLTAITSPDDVDRIESELRDQFGQLPEQVVNLMGIMLIRHYCKRLGVRDLSSGTKTISLAFTDGTALPAQKVVGLAQMQNKKFSITPDNRLIIRMNEITWPNIYDELRSLEKLCPSLN